MARIRTFIAVDVGDAVRARAAALQEKLARQADGVKWVDPESMHLTLLFLGDVDELDVVSICRVVARGVSDLPPFELHFEGLGVFPNPRRPKVLWVGIRDGIEPMQSLHQRLETPLLELGCYRREDRPYHPHLTLGRLGPSSGRSWESILHKHADWQGGGCRVEEVLVMSSDLRRDGPVYTIMGRGSLDG